MCFATRCRSDSLRLIAGEILSKISGQKLRVIRKIYVQLTVEPLADGGQQLRRRGVHVSLLLSVRNLLDHLKRSFGCGHKVDGSPDVVSGEVNVLEFVASLRVS